MAEFIAFNPTEVILKAIFSFDFQMPGYVQLCLSSSEVGFAFPL